jgi:hypothetical protein
MKAETNPSRALPGAGREEERVTERGLARLGQTVFPRWREFRADVLWVIGAWLRPPDAEARWEQDGRKNGDR